MLLMSRWKITVLKMSCLIPGGEDSSSSKQTIAILFSLRCFGVDNHGPTSKLHWFVRGTRM